MRTTYTDVDRLILERWHDTMNLFEAYEQLEDRVQDSIDEVGERLAQWGLERDYTIETDAKKAEYYAYKGSWMNRRRDDALVYVCVASFAPLGFRKIKEAHPSLWVCIDGFRMKGVDREEFGRELRTALGEQAKEWRHEDASDADWPVGKALVEVTDSERVQLITDPERLYTFATGAFEQLFALSDVIDQTLAKFRARE
jgi:hypothetical protein